MKKQKLTSNQIIIFFEFLKWACKEEPKNFSEWFEQYVLLCTINAQLEHYIKEEILTVTDNESWAIHNYFAAYIDEIKEFQKGVQLFKECCELFELINNNLYQSQYPASIFIDSEYTKHPKERILINPNTKP